jgi:hypothetical protein
LLPTAVETAMRLFRDTDVAKVHWPMLVVNEHGRPTGDVLPRHELSEGDVRDTIAHQGPTAYTWPPTSGNAWRRTYVEPVFPIPEAEYRTSPDLYLSALVPLYGRLMKAPSPQGCYRTHGSNNTCRMPFMDRMALALQRRNHSHSVLAEHCRRLALIADRTQWEANSWWHQTEKAVKDVLSLVPAGDAFLLVGGDQWAIGDFLLKRRRLPFLERDGQYWGSPPDDRTAIRELERMRQIGATFAVFPWWAHWWLQHYVGLHQHLRSSFRCALEDDRIVAFDLRASREI